MDKIRFLTAGESHGQALTAIIEGFPAGLEISEPEIAAELKRRQRGYGRGDRMKIESDYARILSGVRYGKTLGSPITLKIDNRDWPNWVEKMSVEPVDNPAPALQIPRPGHADWAGMIKFRHDDLRNILERSSARETAIRVAAGAIAKALLNLFDIDVYGHVLQIGCAKSPISFLQHISGSNQENRERFRQLFDTAENSPTACADAETTKAMMAQVDSAREKGDTLGGIFELVAVGVPVGLGSHVHWDKRLDGQIAGALMSVNAIKAVEIGLGREVAEWPGRRVHDEFFYEKERGFFRGSNHAGGIEGGMSNGQPIIVRLTMKPIPTLGTPLQSVDVSSLSPEQAFRERADVCAVPAAVVVGEAMLALVIADALCAKLGGDSVDEMKERFKDLPDAPLGW